MLEKQQSRNFMENLKTIKKYHIFKNIEEKNISSLLRCLNDKVVRVINDVTFIKHQDKIHSLYIVISGIARNTVIDIDGNFITQIDYTEGDIIGLEYFYANRRTFLNDISAATDMTLLLVDSFRFVNPCQNFCPRHAALMQNAFTQLAKQASKNTNRILELTQPTTKEKVLTYLNNIKQTKKSNEFDIPYNRQELAAYLGVERTALSKELSDLKKIGKIDYHLNHFIIK